MGDGGQSISMVEDNEPEGSQSNVFHEPKSHIGTATSENSEIFNKDVNMGIQMKIEGNSEEMDLDGQTTSAEKSSHESKMDDDYDEKVVLSRYSEDKPETEGQITSSYIPAIPVDGTSAESISSNVMQEPIDRPKSTTIKGKRGQVAKKSVPAPKRVNQGIIGIRYVPFRERHIEIKEDEALSYIDGARAVVVTGAISDPERFLNAVESRQKENEVKLPMNAGGIREYKMNEKKIVKDKVKPSEENSETKIKRTLLQYTTRGKSNSVERIQLQKSSDDGKPVDEMESLSKAISIAGLNDDEIATIFDLRDFAIVITKYETLQIHDINRKKESKEERFCAASNFGPAISVSSEECSRNRKKRREACSSSPESGRDDEPTIIEQQNVKRKKIKKKEYSAYSTRVTIDHGCHVCHRLLSKTTETWIDVLGEKSVYCSLACVQKQVDEAKELIEDPSASVMLLDQYGAMVSGPAAPTTETLYDFLCSHADFTPILPSQKSTKAKTEKDKTKKDACKGNSSKLESILSKDTDRRRLQVKRAISDKLLARARKTPNLLFSSNELKSLSQKIEEELFRQCNQTISNKYRSWFKGFISNIDDDSNQGLYLRVIVGEVTVPRLVSTDPNELNSAALSSAFEIPKMKRIKDEIIDSSSENTANKNNVSEISGNDKNDTVPNETIKAPKDLIEKKESVSKKITTTVKMESELDKILSTENTTAMHRSHLFNLNCDLCTGKKDREHSKKKLKAQEKALEKKKILEEQAEKSSSNNITNLITVREDECGDYDDIDDGGGDYSGFQFGDDDDNDHSEGNTSQDHLYFRKRNQRNSETQFRPKSQNANDLDDQQIMFSSWHDESWRHNCSLSNEKRLRNDSWRQMSLEREQQHSPIAATSSSWRIRDTTISPKLRDSSKRLRVRGQEKWPADRNVQSIKSLRDFTRSMASQKIIKDVEEDEEEEEKAEDEEYHPPTIWEREERHIIWSGIMVMGHLFTLTTTMTALSNEKAFFLRRELKAIIRIIGRIKPIIVFDYLNNLRKSEAKDVIVLRLDRPVNPEMEEIYMKCFEDMRMRKRYCVVASEHVMLKDAYLIPLDENEEPPAVLPFDGPGIPVMHPPVILCVIIRFKDIASALLSRNSDTAASSMIATKSSVPLLLSEISSVQQFDLEREILMKQRLRPPSSSVEMAEECVNVPENRCSNAEAKLHNQKLGMVPDNVPENVKEVGMQGSMMSDCDARRMETNLASSEISRFTSEKYDEDNGSHLEASNEKKSGMESNPIDSTTFMLTVNSISDLLHSIHAHNDPSKIAMLVSEYAEKNILTAAEGEMIERAVRQKINFEMKKRENDAKSVSKMNDAKMSKESGENRGKNVQNVLEKSSFPGSTVENIVVNGKVPADIQSPKVDLYKAPIPPQLPVFPSQLSPSTSFLPAQLYSSIPPPPPPPPPSSSPKTSKPVTVPTCPTPFPPSLPQTNAYFSSLPSSSTSSFAATSSTNPVTSDANSATNSTHVASGQGAAGEMDMDISDGEMEASEKSADILLLPPPPPPPAFTAPPSSSGEVKGQQIPPIPATKSFSSPVSSPFPTQPLSVQSGIVPQHLLTLRTSNPSTARKSPHLVHPVRNEVYRPSDSDFVKSINEEKEDSKNDVKQYRSKEMTSEQEKVESLDHPYKVRESSYPEYFVTPKLSSVSNIKNDRSNYMYASSASGKDDRSYAQRETNDSWRSSWSENKTRQVNSSSWNDSDNRSDSASFMHHFFREYEPSNQKYKTAQRPEWTDRRNSRFSGHFRQPNDCDVKRRTPSYASDREESWTSSNQTDRIFSQSSTEEPLRSPYQQLTTPQQVYSGPTNSVTQQISFSCPGARKMSNVFRGTSRGRDCGSKFQKNYW